MPKWLLIKLMRTLVFAVHTGEKAVYVYREYVSPVVVGGACVLAVKVAYDEYYGIGIFAKNNEEVEVNEKTRKGKYDQRTSAGKGN